MIIIGVITYASEKPDGRPVRPVWMASHKATPDSVIAAATATRLMIDMATPSARVGSPPLVDTSTLGSGTGHVVGHRVPSAPPEEGPGRPPQEGRASPPPELTSQVCGGPLLLIW